MKTMKLPNYRNILPTDLGWEEFVEKIYRAYDILTKTEKVNTSIIVGNYGEAGAIEHFGKKYDLPKPISGFICKGAKISLADVVKMIKSFD